MLRFQQLHNIPSLSMNKASTELSQHMHLRFVLERVTPVWHCSVQNQNIFTFYPSTEHLSWLCGGWGWRLSELFFAVLCTAIIEHKQKLTYLLTILTHSYLLTSVGTPSATALLQHRIQFLLPLKIVPPYTVSSTSSSLTSQPSSLTINIFHLSTWRLPAPPIRA